MINVERKARIFFIAFLGLTVFAVVTNFISFVSPYWIQSTPESHSQFQRIGLWTACFNGYMRPGQYDKAYFGCYYIYYLEYDRIREWINPIWFYAIQVLSSCGMLVQSLVLFVVLCQTTNAIKRDNLKVAKFNLVGHFLTCVTLAASLVAFAIARYDSTWMPFPQYNVLSWSYAVAVLSFVLTLSAFLLGFVRYMYLDAVLDEYQEALLRNQADPGISSPPPMKDQGSFSAYAAEERLASDQSMNSKRFGNREMVDAEDVDDEMIDEEAANADFEEPEIEMTASESNFDGLDPRYAPRSRNTEEHQPMLHYPRA